MCKRNRQGCLVYFGMYFGMYFGIVKRNIRQNYTTGGDGTPPLQYNGTASGEVHPF